MPTLKQVAQKKHNYSNQLIKNLSIVIGDKKKQPKNQVL